MPRIETISFISKVFKLKTKIGVAIELRNRR